MFQWAQSLLNWRKKVLPSKQAVIWLAPPWLVHLPLHSNKQAVTSQLVYRTPRITNLISISFGIAPTRPPRCNSHPMTGAIQDYIDSTLGRVGVSMATIVRHLQLGVSAAHADRIFTRDTGMGVKDYSRRLRLLYAASRLAYTSHSIKEIAIDAGYANVQHFSRAFKNVVGITPTDFRAQHNVDYIACNRSSIDS